MIVYVTVIENCLFKAYLLSMLTEPRAEGSAAHAQGLSH